MFRWRVLVNAKSRAAQVRRRLEGGYLQAGDNTGFADLILGHDVVGINAKAPRR